jgi:exosortase family protein XrtF
MPVLNFHNKITRFFIYASSLYLAWFLFYELILKPQTRVDEKLIGLIISQTVFVLKILGFTTYTRTEEIDMQLVGVDGAHPVWIGSPCNAISLFALFTLFVLAFPGNIKNKVWFIPAGIMIIHFSNVLRVISLVLIGFYAPQYLDFNHTYTFTIIVYSIIFSLWMWWINFSLKRIKRDEPKA